MRYSVIFVGLLTGLMLLPLMSAAQDVTPTTARDTAVVLNKYVVVKEDRSIEQLTERYDEYNREKEFTDGYRIQIMYTDIRNDAYRSKGQMYKDFPDIKSYVEYEEPSYKLRIGDFKSRLEATRFMQQVTPLYPGAFIIKTKIRIKQ